MFSRALKQPRWKYEYSKNKKLFSLKYKLNPQKIGEAMYLTKFQASSQELFVKILLLLWNTFFKNGITTDASNF